MCLYTTTTTWLNQLLKDSPPSAAQVAHIYIHSLTVLTADRLTSKYDVYLI